MRPVPRRAASWLAALVALLAVAPAARAQRGGPEITAQLDTGLVRLGSTVQCRVTVEGARDAELVEVQKVAGLEQLERAAPSVSSQYSIINGRRSFSRTITWQLRFRPARLGEYTIPPMTLLVDGERMFTRELTLTVVEDLQGMELGHIEFVDLPERVYEGQPFTVELLAGWDSALGEGVNYMNLILPWWGELPGTLELDTGEDRRAANRLAVVLNSRQQVLVERAPSREIRGRSFQLFRLRRTFVATRSGELEFAMSYLEFGKVIDDLLTRRKQTHYAGWPAFKIQVRPLPEDGRPVDFSGAVGRIAVGASADRRDVDVGDSIKLTVEWTGDANLEFFQPPDPSRLPGFQGFRLFGTTDRFYGDRRVAIYDIAPTTAEPTEIPGLPLVIFDPELEQYRSVSTQPIPIRVRALEGASALEVEASGGAGVVLALRDIQTGEGGGARAPAGPGGLVVGGAMALLPLAWIGLRTAVRRRGDPDSAEARRRRGALRRLTKELRGAASAGAQAAALQRFLAARSGEGPQAWEGRDPRAWAESAQGAGRLDAGRVRELARLVAELDARRFAGGEEPLDPSRILECARSLVQGGL